MIRDLFKPFDWSGTVPRRTYWLALFVAFSIAIGCLYLKDIGKAEAWILVTSLAVLQLLFWSVLVRRLHDMGRNGIWSLLFLVPLISAVALLWIGFAKSKPNHAEHWIKKPIHLVGQTLLMAVIAIGLSRAFWAPYWVPSGSMKPTLLIGDYFLVSLINETDTPQRGDLVIFRNPTNNTDFIDRLIGLPGDTVQIRNGHLHINSTAVGLESAGEFEEAMVRQGQWSHFPRCANGPVGHGAACIKSQFLETLPEGSEYHVLNIGNQTTDNTGVFQVPENHYFVMGDNRDNSNDSRTPQVTGGVGFVPRENLIGRVDLILFSSAGSSLLYVWTWRKDRFFKQVR
ncbi:MAG: signal peptidase I [Rhodobacteraceae bacterium]|nr:MAG: signal peptidase I [Paracoccaceae bacterium]